MSPRYDSIGGRPGPGRSVMETTNTLFQERNCARLSFPVSPGHGLSGETAPLPPDIKLHSVRSGRSSQSGLRSIPYASSRCLPSNWNQRTVVGVLILVPPFLAFEARDTVQILHASGGRNKVYLEIMMSNSGMPGKRQSRLSMCPGNRPYCPIPKLRLFKLQSQSLLQISMYSPFVRHFLRMIAAF